MTGIRNLAEGLWTVEQPHKFLGTDVGGRMNVIRLSSGGLSLHSPVRLTDELGRWLGGLGEVNYIVAPNRFHHLYVGDYARSYPGARLLAAPGLPEKRRDLPFSGALGESASADWNGEIEILVVSGMRKLNEVVFLHKPSRTLILTDLLFNFSENLTAGQKVFAFFEGVRGKPSVWLLMRYVVIKDKEAVRKSFERILEWDFDRILLAHKDIVEKGGREAFRRAYEDF